MSSTVSSGSSLLMPPAPSRSISYSGTRVRSESGSRPGGSSATSSALEHSPSRGSSSTGASSSVSVVRPRAATSSAIGNRTAPPSLAVSTAATSPGRSIATGPNVDPAKGTDTSKRGRARSSSIVSVTEVKTDYDEALDQEVMQNINADWVNFKGAWLIHVVLIVTGKVLIDVLPIFSQDVSWSLVLQGYLVISYLMFHYVTGTPFDAHGGAFDSLTLWEQLDHGAQYTPAKKWLTSLPIGLFLLSTHYTRYDRHPTLFVLNFASLVGLGLAPKLPAMHRLRIRFFQPEGPLRSINSASALNSPVIGRSGPPTPIQEADEPETPITAQLDPAFRSGIEGVRPSVFSAPMAATSA